MSNQSEHHADIRTSISPQARDYNSDWHAQFTKDLIAAGPFNARMIAWINAELSTSYSNMNDALRAYAVNQGFTRFNDVNNLANL